MKKGLSDKCVGQPLTSGRCITRVIFRPSMLDNFIFQLSHYPIRRYSLGERPARRLKYLPKKVCDGKFRWSLIC